MREDPLHGAAAWAALEQGWPHLAAALSADDLRVVEGGTESERYRFRVGHARYVLSRGTLEAWAAPLAAMGAAYRARLVVPRAVPTVDGSTVYLEADEPSGASAWVVTTWIGGKARADWGRLSGAVLFRLGYELARLHAALADLPPEVAPWPAGAVPSRPDKANPERARRGTGADQVLHGDPTSGNVLLSGPGVGRRGTDTPHRIRVGFVDFARASRGAVEWDLARACVSLPPWARPYRPDEEPWDQARRFLAGYEAGGGRIDPERLRDGFLLAAREGAAWAETAAHGSARLRARARRWARRVADTVQAGAAFPLP